jgi:microcystin-dependent protein
MRDLIDAPDLDAFTSTEGSAFTVHTADDAELVLVEIDTSHNTIDDWENFTLLFRGPVEEQVEGGIHRLSHPGLDDFDVNVSPVCVVDPNPEVRHYQATFTRHAPNREPSRPSRGEVSSRRGFFGKLAATLGGAGLLGTLFGGGEVRAEGTSSSQGMGYANPTLAEIIMFGGTFAPRNWALCNGQVQAISQNTALFSLLGTNYGGDGRTTFALPDLRGRVPMHAGQGPGLTARSLGQQGGTEAVGLSESEMPAHEHGPSLPVSTSEADATTPDGNALGAQPDSRGTVPVYSAGATDGSMAVSSSSAGGGQAHTNVQPYLALNFIIALQGTYPSRS